MVDKKGLTYYVVGGAVRDEIIGKETGMDVERNDVDYVVVGHSAEEMEKRGFVKVGEAFPVFLDMEGKVDGEEPDEWALARVEEKVGESSTGFKFETEEVSLEEDLKRRDFTMNAMAKDPETGEIIDPFGGREDISNGVIRHVSEAFKEDPLRVLRLGRYASRFDFKVSEETMSLAREVVHELEHVSNERIYDEIKKAMKQARVPSKFFDVCYRANVFDYILEEIKEMSEVSAGPNKFHREGDVFTHSLMVLDEMYNRVGNDPKLLLSAFFHDIGKIKGDRYKHSSKGVEVIDNISKRYNNLPKKHEYAFKKACRQHMRVHNIPEMKKRKVIDIVKNLDKNSALTIDELIKLLESDTMGRVPQGTFNVSRIKERIQNARIAIDKVTKEYLSNKHEDWDEWDGKKKGKIVKQNYIEMMKKVEKSEKN